MENLSPFEKGVITSLVSLVATLRSTPGFDGEALTKAAEYFIANPASGCATGESKEAYEWPLSILKRDLGQLQEILNKDQTRN
ncbi:hypothetical protein [Pseudomonas antarctica]|uniref:hypothetical protein n=1 Tax=Pseudomonas antarctica TaxID=219572 RepID=UPI00387B7747